MTRTTLRRALALTLPAALENELEQRLALIYLGRPHSSSAVHEMVIRGLEDAGPDNEKINPDFSCNGRTVLTVSCARKCQIQRRG